ncbi:MAG: dipeptidase [Thermoanaerobaculia bacterium]
MRTKCIAAAVAVVSLFASIPEVDACTNILVTKGASADGSTMITYAADSHELYGELYYTPARSHAPGTLRDVVEWDTGKFLGRIPQPAQTYSVVGNMNEHQVAIGETTFGGRKELEGPAGIVDYGSLMYIALERSKTAREAIKVMTSLADEFGYASTGESFSISDPNEVWMLEMIGKGKEQKGAVWVARRIPDGYISAHANQARIRQFPLNDPQNVLYSKDVISFARGKGWFSGKDADFSFADTYAPLDFGALRFCESRVWSVFRRAAPSVQIAADYVKGVPGAEPMPLWVKPDNKLAVRDTIALMRDHFEGTDLDLSKGVGAGPYKLPYRWRPMTWKVDGQEYLHERAISTQQTGFSFVTQSRSWLPDPVGGILWFGLDDTFTTVYVPMYAGIREVPKSFAVGTADFSGFSWDSAFWVFNFVSNWTYGRWSDAIVDLQKVQSELESQFIADQPEIEKAAVDLYQRAPGLARDYLTAYSVKNGDMVTARWRKLGEFLLWKYNDGNVRNELGEVTHPPYCETWYQTIAKDGGDNLKVKPLPSEAQAAQP